MTYTVRFAKRGIPGLSTFSSVTEGQVRQLLADPRVAIIVSVRPVTA